MRLSTSERYRGHQEAAPATPSHPTAILFTGCHSKWACTPQAATVPSAVMAEAGVALMQPPGHHDSICLSVQWGWHPPGWGHPAAGAPVPIGHHSKTCRAEERDPWPGLPQPGWSMMVPLLVACGAWPRATPPQGTALGWCETDDASWLNLGGFERQRPPYCLCAHFCVSLTRMIGVGFCLQGSYTPPAVVAWGEMGSKPGREVAWPDTVPASFHLKCRCRSLGARGFPWRLQKGGEGRG